MALNIDSALHKEAREERRNAPRSIPNNSPTIPQAKAKVQRPKKGNIDASLADVEDKQSQTTTDGKYSPT